MIQVYFTPDSMPLSSLYLLFECKLRLRIFIYENVFNFSIIVKYRCKFIFILFFLLVIL